MSQPSHPSRLLAAWSSLLEREPSHRPLWLRWGVAVVVTVFALWLRLEMGPPSSGARFATLTMAVLVSSIYGGFSSGLLSTLLGLVLANYFLIQPYGEPAIEDVTEALWLNATVLMTHLVIVSAIWVMQRRNHHLRDLTQQLSASQKKLQNTFEHAAAGITHVGLNGELLKINQTFCSLVGYSEAELRSMSFQDITHPDDVARDVGLLNETLQGKRHQYSLEKRYIHKDGHLVWAQLTVALMRMPGGEPDYFISVVQDISAVKSTEEALRTSERLMQKAQAAASLVTWEADIPNMRFRTFGDAFRRMGLIAPEFGFEQIFLLTHPDEHVRLETEWVNAIKGRKDFQGAFKGHPKSHVRWFNVMAEFERDERGHAIRAFGISQDISARKLAELEIQRLNTSLELRIQERTRDLKGAYAELESYSYAVAHDLRSPLRIINGFAQALEEDNPSLSPESQVHLQRIKSSSRKMGQLIDGLLQLSQFARGELVRQPVHISAIARRQLSDLARDQPDRKVTWSVEPNLRAQADPTLIEALLQNLLHNAWKYTAKTPDATINVYQDEINGQARFWVADNGAGFDMDRASKLFQPFQRLHLPQEFEGLGVGLATARRIVQRHGGELQGEGATGKGAKFSFTLPDAAPAPEAKEQRLA